MDKSKNLANYKVLITTSGVGSRIADIIDYTNKSLVVIGDKPAICYIIENYPVETSFVITLGHFGDHVQEFLQLCYPKRKFEFVKVLNYNGPGSSLALSIQSAKKYLQAPFIFHACDTIIIGEKIPTPSHNWVGGFKSKDATNYTSFDTIGGQVKRFHDKGMTTFDFIHIGIAGINSYKEFWQTLEDSIKKYPQDSALNDVSVIKSLIILGESFVNHEFENWIDIGNSNSLTIARNKLGSNPNLLEKSAESISIVGNNVYKFFSDTSIVKNRVDRAEYLKNLIPKIEGYSKHFYCYKYQPGAVLSRSRDTSILISLLSWANENLWIRKYNSNIPEFRETCREFYLEKSKMRINLFLESRGIEDKKLVINSNEVPTTTKLLELAEDILLDDLIECGFHGDFILDNIITDDEKFKLIDWRESFSGNLQFGDLYYDLAKLNHSLHINHDIVNRELFFVEASGDQIECGILRNNSHVIMQKELENFARLNKLSIRKIRTLSALIWLNMSPLHHHPFDLFLHYYGKLNLWRAINELEV
jgi:NDP-sugar pyrophosphorylase family protein